MPEVTDQAGGVILILSILIYIFSNILIDYRRIKYWEEVAKQAKEQRERIEGELRGGIRAILDQNKTSVTSS